VTANLKWPTTRQYICIHKLFNEYNDLEKLGQPDKVVDPFVVEMSKFMYPNTNDNLQIRQDPPISNVFKVQCHDDGQQTTGGDSNIVSGFILKQCGSPFPK
jgi:hypothetical protein